MSGMMWNAIAQMIIKASDNINRGVENAATNTGSPAQQNYGDVAKSSLGQGGGTGGYQPTQPSESKPSLGSGLGGMAKSVLNTKGGEGTSSTSSEQLQGGGGTSSIKSTLPEQLQGATGSDYMQTYASDERLKNISGGNQDIIDLFSKINSIEFTYNDKAKKALGNKDSGVDNDRHVGVIAQELASNPITSSAVVQDPQTGYLQVDTKEMTMANSAVLADLCKRVIAIEQALGMGNK